MGVGQGLVPCLIMATNKGLPYVNPSPGKKVINDCLHKAKYIQKFLSMLWAIAFLTLKSYKGVFLLFVWRIPRTPMASLPFSVWATAWEPIKTMIA